MLLAALLDAGASLDAVRSGLAGLRVEPIGLELAAGAAARSAGRAARASTRRRAAVERHLADVLSIVDGCRVARGGRRLRAGRPSSGWPRPRRGYTARRSSEVHFHEVGRAGRDRRRGRLRAGPARPRPAGARAARIVAPVAVGSGTVGTAHGTLPVPAPAVLRTAHRRRAHRSRAHDATFELCTPTGAALLATLATGWGTVPDCTPRAVGVGAGRADPPGHPNVLRVLVGSPAGVAPAARTGWTADLVQIESTVDDLDPSIWPDLLERLRAAGAADAWCTPVLMRKGRPGQLLTRAGRGGPGRPAVPDRLRADDHARRAAAARYGGGRCAATRSRYRCAGGTVHVKRGFLGDRVVTAQPEYDDLLAVSTATGLPVAEVLAQAVSALSRQAGTSGA